MRKASVTAAVAVAVVVLFLLYWRQAASAGVSSDAASIVLQGSDMLHGNVLLHGWRTADVSFYGTELVQYMLLQAVLPMSPGLVFVAGAMTYTLLVVLAGWLARGAATGREGLLRAGLAAGIMLAPALGDMTASQLHAPDHLGSAVPVLLAWLVIERFPARWYVPVLTCLLLAWGTVADPLIEITGAAAIVIACGARSGRRLLRREPVTWFEPSLVVAAAASAGVAQLALMAIRAAGGFTASPVDTGFMGLPGLWQHAAVTGKGLLALFGAAFWTEHPERVPAWQVLFSGMHLIGVALAVAGFALALRRFFRADSLLAAGLSTAIAGNAAAFMTSRYATDLLSVREAAAVLPFAAVLAGRLVPGHLLQTRRIVPVLAAVGLVYAGMLGVNAAAARPAAPSYQNVASWLSRHHLTNGLAAGYWLSNIVTVDSGGRVKVADVAVTDGTVRPPDGWETDTRWYDPTASDANFLLTDAGSGSGEWRTQLRAASRAFGAPAETYRFAGFTVFTWPRDVLPGLGPR